MINDVQDVKDVAKEKSRQLNCEIDKELKLQERLNRIAHDLRDAVDMTIEMRQQSPQSKGEVTRLWENFLGQFLGYIKHRSKESKDNLLSGISWTRMKLF
ncbi:MAG TPA: hypothetical protein PKA28_03555 [Methylomusa anaerophila]|uniref:Histidine kinase n=1 Tax=Methylomusa anaerophila TaxID=1930071 RepID=A0A348ANJ6_9FIRM|nr:hypothetical protein [Methylomusa anaerophila]BBB92644.1 hypothetical protein MAMMFC1_03339 [Methylomusa anaerophila]HML87503.1 hypothetical protein [Methylomusa anaerophila]